MRCESVVYEYLRSIEDGNSEYRWDTNRTVYSPQSVVLSL